jgi:hypothetical protein
VEQSLHDKIARESGLVEVSVSCCKCGKRLTVNGAVCLRDGWPLCCGLTMGFWGDRRDMIPKIQPIRPLRQLDLR